MGVERVIGEVEHKIDVYLMSRFPKYRYFQVYTHVYTMTLAVPKVTFVVKPLSKPFDWIGYVDYTYRIFNGERVVEDLIMKIIIEDRWYRINLEKIKQWLTKKIEEAAYSIDGFFLDAADAFTETLDLLASICPPRYTRHIEVLRLFDRPEPDALGALTYFYYP